MQVDQWKVAKHEPRPITETGHQLANNTMRQGAMGALVITVFDERYGRAGRSANVVAFCDRGIQSRHGEISLRALVSAQFKRIMLFTSLIAVNFASSRLTDPVQRSRQSMRLRIFTICGGAELQEQLRIGKVHPDGADRGCGDEIKKPRGGLLPSDTVKSAPRTEPA
jgi:hypothetical protein